MGFVAAKLVGGAAADLAGVRAGVVDMHTPTELTLALARYDMTRVEGGQASEGLPNGAYSTGTTYYDWALNPFSAANAGMYGITPPAGWDAITPWLQVYYEAGQVTNDTNTRVELRNLQLWVQLISTSQWICLSLEEGPLGAYYPENFSGGGAAIPLDFVRTLGGGAAIKMQAGYAFHGYNRTRLNFPVGDIAAVYSSFEARLVLDDPSGVDDRATTHYVASGGADYWLSTTALDLGGLVNNGPVMMGRFKRVTNDWKLISSHTRTPAQMLTGSDIPPASATRSYVEAGFNNRMITLSSVYNGLDRTASGRALDARQGKVLNDAVSSLSATVSGISAALGAEVVSCFEGVPSVAAALNGKTVLVDSANAPIAFKLPAATTGALAFRVIQAGTQPIVFIAESGAVIRSPSSYTQTNGQWKEYVVRLLRNANGSAAEWSLSGDLVVAGSTPTALWTPYQHGVTLQEVWFDALATGSITTVGAKVSQIVDKSQNGRTVVQATDAIRPTLATVGSRPAFTASPSGYARMAWTGAALSTLLDWYYNGGAFLAANIGNIAAYANEPFAEKIIVLQWTPTNVQIFVNGNASPANNISGTFNSTGSALLVHSPSSAGQSKLGRVLTGSAKTFMNNGNGDRGYDGAIREVLVSTKDISSGVSDKERLAGYAAHRWALTSLLPSGHTYKSTPPTF